MPLLKFQPSYDSLRPEARGPLKSGAWGGRHTCHPQMQALLTSAHHNYNLRYHSGKHSLYLYQLSASYPETFTLCLVIHTNLSLTSGSDERAEVNPTTQPTFFYPLKQGHTNSRCRVTGANKFFKVVLIFVGLQYENCFLSHVQYMEF